MTVGLITTNYNTWSLSSECIQHCLLYADDVIDQFVTVDDCSTESFENQFDSVKLIRNKQNMGLVKSLNVGLKAVDTDLVILFDSDAWPLENFVAGTKEYFKNNPKVGIAAYTTENAKGPAVSYEAEPDAMSILLGQKMYGYYLKIFRSNPKRITAYTCAMVLRKEVIRQIGGFDEGYDWLELDHDICMSAIRKGWGIGVIPIRAFHKGSGTPQKVSKRVIRFYTYRIKLLRKFNKYPLRYLLNTIVVIRLFFEYLMINTLGRIKFSAEVREDKSYSRRKLMSMFIKGEL